MDHFSIPVSDAARSQAFYEATLSALGWSAAGFRDGVYAGFRKPGAAVFYVNQSDTVAPVHLAFTASSEDEVRAFHAAALEAGAADHGQPGPRPEYGDGYYAAFILDPDGHNVEAVLGGVR
jgi:catechol 2,3-dioxygenase-like lactoylglutathione lyase family enzyme